MSRSNPHAAEPLLFLVGPTASGKTELALLLGERTGAWVVSMDSMQVYRRMDIGTAKPGPAERARVPHFALDVVEPSERYDVQRYLADAGRALAAIRAAGRPALFVGGTGLYLRALVQGLFSGPDVDPELRARLEQRFDREGGAVLHAELERHDPAAAIRIHARDRKRLVRALEVLEQTGRTPSDWQRQWGWHGAAAVARPHRIVGTRLSPEELEPRIRSRIAGMLERGWAEEARAIRDGPGFGPTASQALGYREVLELADGRVGRSEVEETLSRLTRRFVRRQNTWFRSFPEIRWLDGRSSALVDEARRELGL